MIRAIIIDDEQHCIDRLTGLVNEHLSSAVHIMDSFKTVADAEKAIPKYKPELVFLDVQLHDKTAFDLLKKLGEINFEVIFTTAYEKYAVQAFKFSALDYLLKPVDTEDLKQAIRKIGRKKNESELPRKFEILLENVEQLKQYTPPKKIIVPTINGFELLPVIDILRCQSEVNYTTIYMKGKQKLVVAKTLKEFEEMLTELGFFRVHNSHLINLAYVKSYHKGKGGTVTLIDGTMIEVSTRRKDDFLKKMAEV